MGKAAKTVQRPEFISTTALQLSLSSFSPMHLEVHPDVLFIPTSTILQCCWAFSPARV